ncbi:phosphate ABC transporter permease PstA [Alteromonas gilva]|uniref:Phosphate transport system permease protein PstA n=1 Tax=Alteromonas gilva TaxID=2987522 RepID=A0ABT5KZB9_9ALTE|nr:phosphate ABC transporter permease PstA [Alteromonas gilva]MDC8830101.1 phosphate ABC transporter permease PstA [Alteromonas gilva]
MGKWSIRQLLSHRQQQSYVINLGAFCAALLVVALVCLLGLITLRGVDYFWPRPVESITFTSPTGEVKNVYAQIGERHINSAQQNATAEVLFQYSDQHHPYGRQVLIESHNMGQVSSAPLAANILLTDGTRVFSQPIDILLPNGEKASLQRFQEVRDTVGHIRQQIESLRETRLAPIHRNLAQLDLKEVEANAPARLRLYESFDHWQQEVLRFETQLREYQLHTRFSDGAEFVIPIDSIARLSYPGQLDVLGKLKLVWSGVGDFLTQAPKQANTAGGVFPALFGTVLMIFVMTILVTPFGVLAAVYLVEYAPNNHFTSVIRICVSNMAGVPSIVYGVFGLGFFVYSVGGSIDELFFSDSLPAPTMGTPGVFWASLTMAILTLPVVIVATEEGLKRVPEGLRAGSYALGATKLETIWHTVLPMASPGIMTGVILAIARAAGEVAPLMMVGAVKFAPNLPFDSEFPYFHLDRQFMHLGVLIYDGAFHSQTDVRSASLMFASCLLLLLVVFVLNIVTVILRRRLRKRYLRGY